MSVCRGDQCYGFWNNCTSMPDIRYSIVVFVYFITFCYLVFKQFVRFFSGNRQFGAIIKRNPILFFYSIIVNSVLFSLKFIPDSYNDFLIVKLFFVQFLSFFDTSKRNLASVFQLKLVNFVLCNFCVFPKYFMRFFSVRVDLLTFFTN